MTVEELARGLLGPYGLVVGLLIAVVTNVMGLWAGRWYIRQIIADRDFYRSGFFRVLGVADKSIDLAKRHTEGEGPP